MSAVLSGRATARGTARLAKRASIPFRRASRLHVSVLGTGTSLSGYPTADARRYRVIVRRALAQGVNVIDTALSYGDGASERAVGAALAEACCSGAVSRDEIVVVTKAGYVPGEAGGKVVDSPGGHSLAPDFLRFAIDRSRANLAVRTLDVLLLHNPEVQRGSLTQRAFASAMRAAFEELERAVDAGKVGRYGIATWDGLRAPRGHAALLDLRCVVAWARDVAGDRHHLEVIEAPFNVVDSEIATLRNQHARGGRTECTLDTASDLGLMVLGSATLGRGRLAREGVLAGGSSALRTSAERAIAFACSEARLASALVGMRRTPHLAAAIRAAQSSAP
jgi:aryl-alcohol dehydrogenase-like predicted oxidoreductase